MWMLWKWWCMPSIAVNTAVFHESLFPIMRQRTINDFYTFDVSIWVGLRFNYFMEFCFSHLGSSSFLLFLFSSKWGIVVLIANKEKSQMKKICFVHGNWDRKRQYPTFRLTLLFCHSSDDSWISFLPGWQDIPSLGCSAIAPFQTNIYLAVDWHFSNFFPLSVSSLVLRDVSLFPPLFALTPYSTNFQ